MSRYICTYPSDVSVRLVRQDELGVTLSCVAGSCIAAVHPVHEVAITVPNREDEDHAALKCVTHDWQTSQSLGLTSSGVAVVLQSVSHDKSTITLSICVPW